MSEEIYTVDLTRNPRAIEALLAPQHCPACEGRGWNPAQLVIEAWSGLVKQPCRVCGGVGVAIFVSYN